MRADQLNEKFDKADWDENESHNLHTENAVELAHAFGTREEVEAMERIADQHMRRGHILPHEIEERSALMKKYYNMLENETNPTVRSKMEGYKILPPMDSKYVARDGLEGPFTTLSGKVVYYDPKEGKYYDPDTDIYLTYDEFRQYDNDYSGIKGEEADDFVNDIESKETNEWVQDSPAQGFSGQEKNFIQELCLRMDGISKTPNGLQWQGKSKTWDEGNVLSDKGKLTTVMLWAKKNIDDLYDRMGSEFKVYSDGNDEGDSGRGQSDGNQIIQNIIGKIGSVEEAAKPDTYESWVAIAEKELGREITNEEKAELSEFWPAVAAVASRIPPSTYASAGTAIGAAASKAGKWIKSKLKSSVNHKLKREGVTEDYANEQHEQLEYIHHVLQECGDGNMDITMVEQAIEYVEDIREQHFDADGSTKSESVNEASVLAHGGEGQYKAVSSGGVVRIMHKGKEIASGDFDSGADGWFVSREGDKGQKFFGNAQDMVDHFADEKITEEEVSVDNEGNIAGYLDTIDEYVAMLFKGDETSITYKNTIAYRIQNAVDDIRTRELGLKPSNVRASYANESESVNEHEMSLLGKVARQMEADAHSGDYTAIEELLHNVTEDEMEAFLSDHRSSNEWDESVEEGVMGTIGQGIDNAVVGAGKLIKKGAKAVAPHLKKAAVDGAKKMSKLGSKNTSYDMKTGKTNTTYGMANATEAYNEDDSSDLEKMQNSYKHNEDRNNHSENILMLAQAFGSRPEIKAVEGLLTIIRRQGYTTPDQSEMMYNAIHKKYYGQLFPAENEGNEFSGELAKAKIDGKKEFKVDGKTYKVKEALIKLIDNQKMK